MSALVGVGTQTNYRRLYYNAYYASSNGGELTPARMGRPTSLEMFIGRTRTRLDPQNNKFLVSDDDARVEQSNNT